MTGTRKCTSFLLAALLVLLAVVALPQAVLAADPVLESTHEGETITIDDTTTGIINIIHNDVTITGSSTKPLRIVVDEQVTTVTLDNVTITAPDNMPALHIAGPPFDGTTEIKLVGTSTLTGGKEGGSRHYNHGVLTNLVVSLALSGTGTLNANGGADTNGWGGMGIFCQGTLTVGAGVTLNANAGQSAWIGANGIDAIALDNSGSITARGADGGTDDGGVGVIIRGESLTNTGTIIATGGNGGTDGIGDGHSGGDAIRVSSPNGKLINSGSIQATGGAGGKDTANAQAMFNSGGSGIEGDGIFTIQNDGTIVAVGGANGAAVNAPIKENLPGAIYAQGSGGSLEFSGTGTVTAYGGKGGDSDTGAGGPGNPAVRGGFSGGSIHIAPGTAVYGAGGAGGKGAPGFPNGAQGPLSIPAGAGVISLYPAPAQAPAAAPEDPFWQGVLAQLAATGANGRLTVDATAQAFLPHFILQHLNDNAGKTLTVKTGLGTFTLTRARLLAAGLDVDNNYTFEQLKAAGLRSGGSPKTGDNSSLPLWALCGGAALAGLAGCGATLRRRFGRSPG